VEEEHATIGFQGPLIDIPSRSHQHALQIFDRSGKWVEWQRIGQAGLKVGRVKGTPQHHALSTMAARHLRLGYEDGRLIAQDLGSLNGVYRLVTRPVSLEDGQRFRIGRYVIEFHRAPQASETTPLVGEDGEEFCSADLLTLGHLDFVGRDGRPGHRHVLTKGREPTLLGRGGRPGRPVDIALPNDDRISGIHAQLRPEGEKFLLEDLGSRNGTFAQLLRPTPVENNDVLLVGQLLLRVVPVG
jgi:pSer/pThr/pTyr-binding forkhead associated (FHA) protein